MSDIDRIKQALTLIEQERSLSDRPALVVMPPDSKNFLLGNRGGFLNLALAALKAAEGEKQSFRKEPWFVVEDYDWEVAGLTLDEDAHIYLPTPLTKRKVFIRNTFGVIIGLSLAISLVVGIGTIGMWLIHLI